MGALIRTTHPEDIKAAIRKRFGSVNAFVRMHELPTTGVSDLLRGRTSARVADAIEQVLQEESSESNIVDSSNTHPPAHLPNGGAK